MSSSAAEHNSSRDPEAIASKIPSGQGPNPLWALTIGGALFFAFAAALLASG